MGDALAHEKDKDVAHAIRRGNWKMNMPPTDLLGKLNEADFKGVEVVCAPSTVHLLSMKAELTKAAVCAQNCYSEPKGAFTGETSPDMLVEAGVNWVLLGHSERRHVFGESDNLMTQKATAVMARPSLQTIICVGEKQEAREGGTTNEVLDVQMKAFAA